MLKRFTGHHLVVVYLNNDSCSTRLSSFFGRGYMYGQLPHQYQQLKQNNLVPKNSYHHSFSFVRGRHELYELRFCPLYSQPPEQLRTSEELIAVCGHGLAEDALLKFCSLFDKQNHERPHQDAFEVNQTVLSYDISGSKLHDTCIPTSSDLSCLRCSLKPPSRDLERSTRREASSLCRNFKALLSPDKAGGLPKRN